MKTKLEVFAAAKTLSSNKSREDLTKDITAQQGIVNKITATRIATIARCSTGIARERLARSTTRATYLPG